ncbi:MAG: S8 family serine peptidase [Bacteroidetes bacterium]|nr:S8 family serine peptidase [Bacteroidota bacterium]MCL1968972.1 S8 family serine peptidase [Bacteroidota bacterium]
MKKLFTPILFIILLSFLSINLSAQKYAVYFTDKNNTPYSIENPEAFLSQRAIDRRARHNIAINMQDLPVNPQYVQALRNLGANVPFTSKWLNCALISCPSSLVNQIQQLPFVSQVVYISPHSYGGKSGGEGFVSQFANKLEKEEDFIPVDPKNIAENYQYGQGQSQISQINGIPVHQQGYTGQGVLIAVLDAGFQNVNSLSVFNNIYSAGPIFTMDVVVPNGNIYASNTSNHGTNVLSCMSANANGQFVGTAPQASYALIRTEDAATEYLVECYNWAVGIEAADSIGADIVNTSLGYRTFDDPSMDYTHAQVDGETPVASFAAKTAIEKGIFVTASAGNDNGSSWPWVGSPGDTKYAGTIGAVNSSGTIAYFSSIGPNGAGDPKPNVCARGVGATVYSTSGTISSADGTSFSSPISCGMYACLIQANRGLHPALLRDIVDETGNRYPNHEIAYGYGIPNFAAALETVLALSILEIVAVTIDDTQGNNNGRLNPGETVNLNITVKNKTTETLSNVNAVISTNSSEVTFINNTANFGTFSPDETKTVTNAFTLTLSENAFPKSSIKFYVTFSYNGNTAKGIFSLDVYGNLLAYKTYAVDDYAGNANGVLEPGETAKLFTYIVNNGNEYASGVTAVLSSTSDLVTINSNSSAIGNMLPTQTKYATFNITVNPNAVPGQISIPFQLQLTDAEGKSRTYTFTYSDKCGIVFELHDSDGDGWNGAAIKVNFDDGTPQQTFTINNGSSAIYTVSKAVGVTFTLSWQPGSYDNECSFIIKYDGGDIIYTASSAPPAGVFYSFVNYCGGAAPPNPPLNAPQYAVHFKDKENTPYSINNPLEYLSQRAIDRRNKYGIAVTAEDLPVDPCYVEMVNMTGAYVRDVSRWANAVLVYAEEDMLNAIRKLDFVDKVVYVKPAEGKYQLYDIHPKWENEVINVTQGAKGDYNYGYAAAQIEQLNGVTVHKQGYAGEGVIIAVLDGGFNNADKVGGFSHLYESGRIVYEENVVEPQRSIYDELISSHGTLVLSCMGGYLEGEYVGTAPKASYALIRTEDTPTEFLIEEYFWMIGAEAADSLGADIINSSLSYITFDDPVMDHKYSDMDGKTAISSIAAKMAVERGVFVTNSAGNNNGKPFPWVGSPADAPEALSLGAVDLSGVIADFSSIGPNGAGYPKPDVVACGLDAAVIFPDNTIGTASGTSFASPITCGMVACIIGAAPNKTPDQIIKAVQQSADRYPEHDIQYGYGIPNFGKVLDALGVYDYEHKTGSKLIYYPNPVNDKLYLNNPDAIIKNVEMYDITGRMIKQITVDAHQISIDVKEINRGFVFVKVIYDNHSSEMVKCVILR